MLSQHIQKDRQARIRVIESIGYGKPVAQMSVDKGHKQGPTTETLSSTGIITVRNQKTRRVVTYIIATPSQVRRFFDGDAPEYLLTLAWEHKAIKK